ncbi:RNA helicase [Paracidovorax avenae]|nr:RNA helicase [Paracidovorax avenae]
MPFAALGLSPALVHAAGALGFDTPTPIQVQAIPAVLNGGDVLGRAQTGSGKTAAFGLPLLQQLLPQAQQAGARPGPRRPRALVLVPTRELAAQVGEVLRDLAAHLPGPRLKIAIAFGGVSINPQLMALRGGADAVVATPGRLLDLVEHNALSLSQVQALVLDEADRLLDLGFAEELQRVLALLPAQRQNLLFSATFEPGVARLAEGLLRDPLRIEIAEAPDIAQRAIAVEAPRRTLLLKQLLTQEAGWTRVLVFVATQYAAEHVAEKLYQSGIYASPFHGGLSQGTRRQVLQEFRDERWQALVTTDLAARGIDIAGLPAVVNYDLPRAAADYVHRIGRTGRAGASGVAVSFVTPEAAPHWQLLARRHGLQALPVEQVAGFEVALAPAAQEAGTQEDTPARPGKLPPGTGGIKGRRPSKKDKLRAAAAAAAQAGGTGEPTADRG